MSSTEMAQEDKLRANTIATYAVEIITGKIDPENADFGWVDRKGKRQSVTREVLDAVARFSPPKRP